MTWKTLMAAVVAATIGSVASAAPMDYRLKGHAAVVDTTTELVVRVLHVPAGRYVPNADVWRVDRHQAIKAGAPPSATRRRLAPDGAGAYRISLPLHVLTDAVKNVYASVPGEAEHLYAGMKSPAAK